MELSSRERIIRVFENKEVDRPPFKLWGLTQNSSPKQVLHPSYSGVINRALEVCDIFGDHSFPFHFLGGILSKEFVHTHIKPMEDPLWQQLIITVDTPKGQLRAIHQQSTIGAPGYCTEEMVKEPEDLEKLLSIPYAPYPIDLKSYKLEDRKIGNRGAIITFLPHAAYGLQDLCGSENLALFRADEPELLKEVITLFSLRVTEHLRAVLDSGVRGIFGWVGPELFLPPLMSPTDFQNYVFDFDQPLCHMIHEAGGYTWVHSHNKVGNFIESFINMGVDVLNPIEPPPSGDVDLASAIQKFGKRIGFEGNIEMHDLMTADRERIRGLIADCVSAGKNSSRFILCQSSGFMEFPNPTKRYLDNLMEYLNYGYQCIKTL